MGLEIINNVVNVTNEHNRLLNINSHINPTIQQIDSLLVYSIFQRLKSTKKNSIGDNCPLLFALKNQKNLTTNITSIKLLIPHLNIIIKKIPINYDIIIPMPSKYNISSILGKRFEKINQSSQTINVFSKKTLISLENEVKSLLIDKRDKKIILDRISLQKDNNDITISLKDIPINLRQYLNPLRINENITNLSNKKILLIDDLLATGTTLLNAKKMLENDFMNIEIHSATLFSSIV